MGEYSKANKPCECGSGKKYKRCCLSRTNTSYEVLKKLLIDTVMVLDMERAELLKRVNVIEEMSSTMLLNSQQLNEINMNLFQLYISLGYDHKAQKILNDIEIDKEKLESKIFILINKMKVNLNLGEAYEAFEIIDTVENLIDELEWNDKLNATIKSSALIEISKTLHLLLDYMSMNSDSDVDFSRVIKLYDELILNFELNNYDDVDHYMGAKSNKASILLKNNSEEVQKKGLEQILEVISEKLKYGYWVGVANSYCSLGLYYLSKNEFKQAIAYTRRDLQITQRYGSYRDEISTLLNLSKIYKKARQISKAKEVLRRAMKVSEQSENSATVVHIANQLSEINNFARELNEKNLPFGPKSPCECGSGKEYEKCCGEADFDYQSIEKVLGLEDILPYASFIQNASEDILPEHKKRLDLLLRKSNEHEIRLSWVDIINKGAYQEVYELPDMTSIYLESAKSLLSQIEVDDNLMKETSVALGVTMLSVSALEAFLNQLIFFLSKVSISDLPEFVAKRIPEGLLTDFTEYQRNERFTNKINIIANIFCNGSWSPNIGKLYTDLFKLINIRNELVHFKSVELFKIIPPPQDNMLLKNLSSEIELRDVSNSWPLKLLTHSFAKWAFKTIDETIRYIKNSYEKANNMKI